MNYWWSYASDIFLTWCGFKLLNNFAIKDCIKKVTFNCGKSILRHSSRRGACVPLPHANSQVSISRTLKYVQSRGWQPYFIHSPYYFIRNVHSGDEINLNGARYKIVADDTRRRRDRGCTLTVPFVFFFFANRHCPILSMNSNCESALAGISFNLCTNRPALVTFH